MYAMELSCKLRTIQLSVFVGQSLHTGLYTVLVGKPEGKRPFGRPGHRWEDDIKTDLQEVGCGVWPGLSWLRI
jgi:hypothetical protein